MLCDGPIRVFSIACAIGLAGEGGAHETKTEMAGDCPRRLAAGTRHGIIVVATRPDHRRIVAEDPNWHDGEGSGGNSGWSRHELLGCLGWTCCARKRTGPASIRNRRSNPGGA